MIIKVFIDYGILIIFPKIKKKNNSSVCSENINASHEIPDSTMSQTEEFGQTTSKCVLHDYNRLTLKMDLEGYLQDKGKLC